MTYLGVLAVARELGVKGRRARVLVSSHPRSVRPGHEWMLPADALEELRGRRTVPGRAPGEWRRGQRVEPVPTGPSVGESEPTGPSREECEACAAGFCLTHNTFSD